MATVLLTRGKTLTGTQYANDFHQLIDNSSATVSNIVNADIDAAAAIADSKLAQITTAGKVSGAAITTINNLPSGAGAVPAANLPIASLSAVNGSAIEVIFDGGGATITSSTQVWILVPKAVTITGAYAFADQSGSIVVDVWKDTIANFPPTDADSITASAPITISTATNSSDTTLTGWTTSVAALAVLKFNVDSCTSIQKCTIVLTFNRA